MFYDNLKNICDSQNVKITPLVLECGGTKGVIGGWKRGAMPNSDIVMKLSVKLNVTTDTLLFGKENSPSSLTENEQTIVDLFKTLTDTQQEELISMAQWLQHKNSSDDTKVTISAAAFGGGKTNTTVTEEKSKEIYNAIQDFKNKK